MSAFVRRLVIFSTVEGLVLQAHGHPEHHKSVLVDFKFQQLSEHAKGSHHHDHDVPRLEAYGLIGFINIASLSYLIAITKRKEVAQIFGNPVYLVTDVALLPLSSQKEANEAIKAATTASDVNSDESETDTSDTEEDQAAKTSGTELATTPADDLHSYQTKNSSSTSIAEEVASRNVSFGRFATQWLLRQKWPASKPSSMVPVDESKEPKPASKEDIPIPGQEGASKGAPKDEVDVAEQAMSNKTQMPTAAATMSLVPRILRTIKMIFTSGSYFFSYDVNLTKRLEKLNPLNQPLTLASLDPAYFWNRNLGAKFLDSRFDNYLIPVLQGFVGQRAFTLAKNAADEPGSAEVKAVTADPAKLKDSDKADRHEQSFLLTLISRRSTKRSGLRYLRRGIDDQGNCANFVETEQILSNLDWDATSSIRSFIQVRGSIPLYFSQSPYSFKPAVALQNSPQANERAYNKHFQFLKQQYGSIQIALLVDRHGTEKPVGEAYEKAYNESKESGKAEDITLEWFDFHAECRGMKFENVSHLVDKLKPFLTTAGETLIQNNTITARQKGVIRTNCMDCLDRTNVAESAFAQHILQASLESEGYSIDLVNDASTNWFNTLWADNGDAISRQYASTAALKGDYTRTRKRNWRGAMNDFGLTISRYYSNMVNDFFSQAVIDVLLGNVSWRIFEDFESTMMSADPGISVQSGREAAIDNCAKIVIQDENEDLIHGWTVLVPAQENTLRTLPFEEAVILLTDAAVYCCRMDWSTEKIDRFEKVELRSIRSVKWGVYITSTFTERQLDEDVNQGVVISYTSSKGDVVRVNTRSLQNYHKPDDNDNNNNSKDRTDGGGTGVLSWLATSASASRQTPSQERMMALKIVPASALGDEEEEDNMTASRSGSPKQMAENVADEVRRAVVGCTQHGEQRGQELVEAGEIISVAEAKRRTGYLEQVGQAVRKFVWA